MADDRKQGWEPWSPERERGGSGVGAFTGKEPAGRRDPGLEGRKREGATGPGEGPPRPEFPPEGWGEKGENYPPTQGPIGEAED
ncbi:MAG TPA: hypothetical protein VGF77_07560 [Allosphingosinicella sp.]|jgi:hypothetical protein